jgi:hypothetical protein
LFTGLLPPVCSSKDRIIVVFIRKIIVLVAAKYSNAFPAAWSLQACAGSNRKCSSGLFRNTSPLLPSNPQNNGGKLK